MSGSSLTVKISADVTSLQAKAAVAKAEFSELASSVKSVAAQYVEASDEMKASLAPQLDAVAQKAALAKTELAALNAELKNSTHPEVTGFFGQLSESARVTGESFENLNARLSVFTNAANAFSEFLLAGLAIEQVGETINHVAEQGEQMDKLAQETGLTTEQLSGLRVMALQTGTDFDQFTTLLDKLPHTLQQAATGTGTAAEAFNAMGIKVTDSNGQLRPMADILDEVAAKLSTYADSTNKTALETDIFGAKLGANLIPMLNQLGQVGIQGAIAESNNLNQTWTGASAEAAEQYERDMGRAKLAVEGIKDALVRDLLPALDAVANAMAPTLDTQISNLQGQVNELGVRASAGMKQQLAELQQEKKEIDASIKQQAQTAGGAPQGSASAPTVAPSGGGADWMKDQTAALDKENEQIEASATSTKEANAEKLQNTVTFWQGVLAAGNLSSGQELQAQDALSKAETALKANQLSTESGDYKSAETTKTQIAADAAEARKAIATSEYDAQVSQWGAEIDAGKMTKAQEVQYEIAAQNQMYQAALAEAQQEAELLTAGTAAKAKANDDIEVMEAAHVATMAQLNEQLVSANVDAANEMAQKQKEAADATSAAWQKAFAPITQAFDSSLNGVLQGTQTLQQAEAKAAQSIALAFIDAEAKKVEAFAVGELQILASAVRSELGMTAAATAGNTTRAALKASADATGSAVDAASNSASIANSAHTAFAGAYAAVAGVPFVGPVLAPAAGAAAYAAVMAMDVLSASGGLAIGSGENPLVQLHENETVLPAYIAQPLTSMLGDGGNMGGDNSVGDTTVNNHFNLTANGGSNGLQPSDLLSMLNTAVRSGSLQGYPALARAMRRGN